MKKSDYELTLAERYPLTCSDIPCGAYFPDAWVPAVDAALEELEWLAELARAQGPPAQYATVSQIKSKFGGLRLYLSRHGEFPVVENAIVRMAEKWVGSIK
jgi:hypothetical protein